MQIFSNASAEDQKRGDLPVGAGWAFCDEASARNRFIKGCESKRRDLAIGADDISKVTNRRRIAIPAIAKLRRRQMEADTVVDSLMRLGIEGNQRGGRCDANGGFGS